MKKYQPCGTISGLAGWVRHMQAEPQAKYIGKRDGKNMYDFRCKCGAECELGVPDKHLVIDCPNAPKCLELFVQRKAVGMFAEPRLLTVLECMT